MRLNVYSQELITDDQERPPSYDPNLPLAEWGLMTVTELISKDADTGIVYSAVRLFLRSPNCLHHRIGDDDRSAITFWLPKNPERREYLARCFEILAQLIRAAPPETGLDR